MTNATRVLAALSAALLLSIGGASAVQADEPTNDPQPCAECGTSKVVAHVRQWSDRQWIAVGTLTRDHVRFPRQELRLQRKRGPVGWTTVDEAVTGQDGRAIFVIDLPEVRSSTDAWRIRYAGDADTDPANSSTFSIWDL